MIDQSETKCIKDCPVCHSPSPFEKYVGLMTYSIGAMVLADPALGSPEHGLLIGLIDTMRKLGKSAGLEKLEEAKI